MNDGARAAGVHLAQGLHKAGSTLHAWLIISVLAQGGVGASPKAFYLLTTLSSIVC